VYIVFSTLKEREIGKVKEDMSPVVVYVISSVHDTILAIPIYLLISENRFKLFQQYSFKNKQYQYHISALFLVVVEYLFHCVQSSFGPNYHNRK